MDVTQMILQLDEAGAFSPSDEAMLVGLVEKIKNGVPLTGKQLRAAYRAGRKYDGQIEYGNVVPPDGDAAAPIALPHHGNVVTIACHDGRILVQSPYTLRGLCKSIVGSRWKATEPKGWTYPESPTSAYNIYAAFASTPMEADEAFTALVAEHEKALAASAHKEDDEPEDIPSIATKPWRHQKRAFWFAKQLEAAGLYLEMGAGKSLVAVSLLVNNDAQLSLVIAPLAVVPVWQREFGIHAGKPVHVVTLNQKSIANRTKMAEHAAHECHCGKPHVLVINYEAAFRNPFAEWSLNQEWDYVVLDEAHRIKSSQGATSKYCYKLSKRAKRRLALTGTPMASSPLDVFGIYRFLNSHIFGTSWTSFSKRFASWGGYGGYQIMGYLNQEELHEKVYSIAYRVTADEVLDLPPTRDVRMVAQLGPKTRKLYDQLEEEMYAEIDEILGREVRTELFPDEATEAVTTERPKGEITAPNVLVKLLRLAQITGGSVNNDEGKPVQVGTEKEELLTEYMDELGPNEPVVVFCRFVHDLAVVERVAEKLKRSYAELSGRRRDGIDSDARMNADVDVVGVQIQSGGVGVDFTRAHYACYYSVSYSLSDYEQSRARLNRPGQMHPVLFTHLVCADTKDEDVYAALAERKDIVEFILDKMVKARRGTE